VVARWLHAASARAGAARHVNAGPLRGLFESELFGHVKGAFTDAKTDRVGRFELADGGTLFLDEIANMSLKQQAKLLRVLQSGELQRVGSSRTRRVDVRVISATNADLRAEVAAGRFREDLLYRLNTVEIRLPPLRERREDVPLLAAHFLREHAARYRKPLKELRAGGAMQALLDHPWPGNVRELRSRRGARGAHGAGRGRCAPRTSRCAPSAAPPPRRSEEMTLEDVERVLIQQGARALGRQREPRRAALG
jgi:DNA-binding NtrC family response regulator